ncbi:hypothetical protein TNCV_2567191 [Trichonephila clavipes]|uniref:Uncharacterized protein n=1 Tax=Trichonephila clavipes TaxID=2585209 RepID=A0A8X6WKC9_TRICX|nr:hypothetical protein TNCV_2567191 [Trichonephila clavipes]
MKDISSTHKMVANVVESSLRVLVPLKIRSEELLLQVKSVDAHRISIGLRERKIKLVIFLVTGCWTNILPGVAQEIKQGYWRRHSLDTLVKRQGRLRADTTFF